MNWDGFGPLILPFAPTCSAPLLKQHARLAAIDFLAYTKAWQVELAPLTGDGVLTSFSMVLPDDSSVEKLLAVDVTDAYGSISHAGVKTALYGARLVRQGSRELIAYTPDRTKLTVLPVRPVGEKITATVALKPSMASVTLPDNVFDQYGAMIAKGALASLTAIKEKPWTDLTTARICAAEFMNAKATTSRQVERGFATSGRPSAIRWY